MSAERKQRRAPRLTTDLPATLRGRTAREVRIVDLSRTGCLVRSAASLDVGVIVDIEAQLDGQAFEAKARVAEVSVDGASPGGDPHCLLGLDFVSLPALQEGRLLAFVERARQRR